MSSLKPKEVTKYQLLILLITVFLTFSAIACEAPQQAVSVSNPAAQVTPMPITNTPVAAATATELAFRSRVLGGPPAVIAHEELDPTVRAWDDVTVKNYADMLTQSALTPPPTLDMNPPPTDTPEPPHTPTIGYEECATVPSTHHQIVPYTCGHWLVNGQIIEAKAGRHGELGDIKQGYLQVACIGHGIEVHDTPALVGGVGIVSTEGTRIHLATYNHNIQPNTFTFDIATCQWVSP